jgi:hypothetical protein
LPACRSVAGQPAINVHRNILIATMPFYNLHLDHVKLIPHPSIIEYTLRRQPSEILQSGQQKLPENNTINLKKLLNEADQTDRNVRYTLTDSPF